MQSEMQELLHVVVQVVAKVKFLLNTIIVIIIIAWPNLNYV